jgi:hypothetical protein
MITSKNTDNILENGGIVNHSNENTLTLDPNAARTGGSGYGE